MSTRLIRTTYAGAAMATALCVTPCARAAITLYDLGDFQVYTQTSDVQPTTSSGYTALEQLFSSPGDFTSALFSGGGTPPTALSGSNGAYQSVQSYSTQAALNSAIPNGATFTFSLTGGVYNGQTATLNSFVSNQYPMTVPYLTGTTFD